MKEWSNLAKVVTRRTYSRRKEDNTLENWNEIIDRAIYGNVKNFNLPEEEIKQLKKFGYERKAFVAGRGLWFSGSPSHSKLGGVALNNCFSFDTEIITHHGIKKIGELCGLTPIILDGNGGWFPAEVKCFGEQELWEIQLSKGRSIKIIHTTENHRWFKIEKDQQIECYTFELQYGDKLSSMHGQGIKGIRPSPFGIAQGFFFGDGTKSSGRNSGQLVICGEKDKAILPYFPHCTQKQCKNKIIISDLPNGWKNNPSLFESKSFLYGWLAGYFAADGSIKEDGQIRIASTNKQNLLYVRDVCAVLGINCSPIIEQNRISNLTKKESILYSINISGKFLTEEFFVIPNHKERYKNHKYVQEFNWKVEKVYKTNKKSLVYCAVVDSTHSFTLADNILTGNCWFLTLDNINNFIIAMDLLMLGGGVGGSVEHKFVSKLPRIKKDVRIEHQPTKDADFIIPDSREGWEELFRRVLESYFITGKGFTYSTICIRGYGEPIKSFGGTASGPIPLVKFVDTISRILSAREGRAVRPIDASDILCATGEMVVAGNVRRSAIIILGDPFDKDYLTAKRWDLHQVPSYRAFANFSVICEDIEDLHPLFWKTYEHGEAFGLVNRKNIQSFGRIGERKRDTAIGTNPCGEATLESFEPCNLQEIFLPNLNGVEEFEQAAVLMHKWGKRVTCEKYHHEEIDRVVKRNRRIGTSITGCLGSSLFVPDILDSIYRSIERTNIEYSKELGIPLSIRTTLNKPSGTLSKVGDCDTEGIHAAWSRAMIQRIRFAANDPLIPMLREAGHPIEPMKKLDGTVDFGTVVVDFYKLHDKDVPCMDEGFDTWKQLDTLLMAQKWWADQSVSVTVTYKKEEIPQIKEWLQNNYKYLKTISFLAYSDHGFEQAPKEKIKEEEYYKLSKKIKPLDIDLIPEGDMESLECSSGSCPIK